MLTTKQIFDKCTDLNFEDVQGTKVAQWPELEFSVHEIEAATHYNNRGKYHLLTNVGVFEICRFPAIVSDATAKIYIALAPIDEDDYEQAKKLNEALKEHLKTDIDFLNL